MTHTTHDTRIHHNEKNARGARTVHPVGGPAVKGLVEEREELPHGGRDAAAVEGEVGHDLEGLLHELHGVIVEQTDQQGHQQRLDLREQVRGLRDAAQKR